MNPRIAVLTTTCLCGIFGAAVCCAADLPACAGQYGKLMVDHWLTVDTLRQLERLLYYRADIMRDPSLAASYRERKQSVENTGRELHQAASLYASLFKNPSNGGIAQLDAILHHIATDVPNNDKQVIALLSEAGKRAAGDSFQAVPVTKAQIEPTWNMRTLVDAKFRPKRILFGSTGHVGDDRILPLDFDFGSGIYSFYVPMTARDKLQVVKPPNGWTDEIHQWMHDHNMGHHYWAGVYNNQNTYVADWFVKQFGKNDDVWMRLIDGKVLRSASGGFGQPNVWNPSVRDYIRNYCETQARYFHDDPTLLCYDYAGEPHPYAMNPEPGGPQYSGYNDSAVAAFHKFLRQKFKSIEGLNRAWNSSYSDFDTIKPPPDPYVHLPEKASPLTFEFELFRCQCQSDYWKLVYDAYRRYDSKKPIEAHASMYMSGWPAQAMNAYQMLKAGVADWIDMHQNNFSPNLPEQIYLYSLCRLTRKVPVEFEYIWTFPRTGPFDESKESDFRATCEASVWRNLVWGKQVFVFFDFYYDWPGYRNGLFDKDLGYSILRPSACVIPAIKRQALRFSDMFLKTEVKQPPIIILQPSASVWNSPPINPHDGFSFHTSAAMKIHDLLYPHNYPFLYVPEEAVTNDGYQLAKHSVVVLPQAPYLTARMT
ncbi:MAG TPA: beta-galactosidase, partial [Lacipirellulaceae bacterium]|nr:beta-galactosidase [Lacipirellulaceae bacterium]